MKKIYKKFLSCLILSIVLLNSLVGIISSATEISSASLVKIGDCDYHLKYYREDTASHRYVICTVVGYYIGNVFYPAYCLNKDLTGVTEDYNYCVNIKDVVNRDDVWRVVKNGYPYKAPQEMGLSNEFNAYAVTKFAVYCILGQSDINKFYADPSDQEAVAMLNALKNLVNIGINGSETRTNGNFSISKVGNLTLKGNYYNQKYKVNSNIEMNNFEIAGVTGFPEGSYAEKIDNTNLTIYIPKDKLTTNISGSINIKGKCKTYPIFYGESGNSNYQDYAITYDSFGEVSSVCKTNFTTNTGKLKVVKIDQESKQKIPNTKFGLYKDGKLLETKITDKNGFVIFTNLFQGKYTVKELIANENYVPTTYDKNNINVTYNQQTEITFVNYHKKGNLKIVKFDKDDKTKMLEGIEFELYKDSGELVGKYVTDSNGEINVDKLNTGKYKLKEVKTNEGYKLLDEITLEIKWNETTELELSNEKNKGKVKIIKVDKENNEIKIPGVKFGIYNENQELLEELITDENGEVESSYYPVYNNKYYIKELETNKKYELNPNMLTIELKENEITTIKFENELKKGNLKLLKLDKDTREPIEGVEFEVYDPQSNLVGTYITDENGIIFVENLKPQIDYYAKETKTKEEYKLSEDIIYFDIKCNETTSLEITNEKIKGKLKVIKVDKDDNSKKLEGVKFDIYDEKSNLLESITTDKEGIAYSSLLPCVNRVYAIVETSTIPGYIKNEEYIFFKLNEFDIYELIIENEKSKKDVEKEEVVIKENEEKIEEVKVLPKTGY